MIVVILIENQRKNLMTSLLMNLLLKELRWLELKVLAKESRIKKQPKKAEASRAELELLLADEKGADTSLKGYNLKPKKAKGKKGKGLPDEGKIPTINYDDARFSRFFTSPLFALDPTDPQFKRSAAYARQIAQKQQKGNQESIGEEDHTVSTRQAQLSDTLETNRAEQLRSNGLPSEKEKHELSHLVRSIKMKSKQVPLPCNNKVSRKKDRSQLNTKARK
ncbi:unnamed protein product [Ilex paraguariensis]|uniref:NUC153 domain-containing protein n=1 Tax=Ilex paraguariensis TaxID=185542 RepID=A0ABC8UGS7_9AQUA